jgi:hypothetical protein
MIRLRETQHANGFSAFSLLSGTSEHDLKMLGSIEVTMHGSMGVNGSCTVYDGAGSVVQTVAVTLGDGGADSLKRAALTVLRGGFPHENDVA